MDNARVHEEIAALSQHYPVEYDLNKRWVRVAQVPLPRGWTPRETEVLFKLPRMYPRTQPKVYLPSKLEFDGRVRHRIHSSVPGKFRLCMRRLDWDQKRHTLVTVLRLVLALLEQPDATNPFNHA